MNTKTVQKTQEWREARVGKVTGSIIGAVLGLSPFLSRQRALRRMVEESMGNMSSFTNPAMEWGNDHEEDAVKLYTVLYAGQLSCEATGFWEKGDIGASPDLLVGDTGMLEIKCPYSLRDDITPAFKSISEMPYYWHQMQMQMYVTDREWCDFLQWTPHDHKLERVVRDREWFDSVSDRIVEFMEEYQQACHAASSGGPAERLAASSGWDEAAHEYAEAACIAAEAKRRVDAARETLINLMKASAVDLCESDTLKGLRSVARGTVDWKGIVAEKLPEFTEAEADEYRGKESVSYKFTVK